MTSLPEWARDECTRCEASIAWVRTTRTKQGAPVDIAVDFRPDSGTGGTVPVQVSGDVAYGNPVSKAQAAAMRAGGVKLHAEHSTSCTKRGSSSRK